MSTWRWRSIDAAGVPRAENTLTDPWADTAEKAADLILARMMVRAWPRRAGRRVGQHRMPAR